MNDFDDDGYPVGFFTGVAVMILITVIIITVAIAFYIF